VILIDGYGFNNKGHLTLIGAFIFRIPDLVKDSHKTNYYLNIKRVEKLMKKMNEEVR